MIELAQHQPNAWSCGPAALRNAMLLHHYLADTRELADLSLTKCCLKGPRYGRCEHGLERAARAHGFALKHHIARDAGEAYFYLRETLPTPVLLCVDHAQHWITVTRATKRHVWILDPARDEELHQRLTQRGLLRRLVYGLPDETSFHLYPLVNA